MKTRINTILILATLIATALPTLAQQRRASPHDTVSAVIGDRRTGNRITLTYGRPYSKDRKIWGGLVPYDKAWRLGADEATLLITQQPLAFGDTTVPAGAYTLYLVPAEGGAKLAISTKLGSWGIPVDETKDLARVDAKKEALDKPVDQLTVEITKDPSGGGAIKISWESTAYTVPFTVKKPA
jgi:nucleoid-associated protein YgaU